MKNIIVSITVLLIIGVSACANQKEKSQNSTTETSIKEAHKESIQWYSMEEGIKLAKSTGKKIFVDVYTDWCGWCKRMDATTFVDKDVVEAMNKDFIAVKFNAEQKEDVNFYDTKYSFKENGRRGYHELAAVLLDGQLSYPSFAVLNSKGNRVKKLVGYMKADQFLIQLKSLN